MSIGTEDESYSPAETARRRDAIVRNMIATPPQKHEPKSAKPKPSTKSHMAKGTAKSRKAAAKTKSALSK